MPRWRASGLPPNPGAWITTTARNRAIDRLRREGSRARRQSEAVAIWTTPPDAPQDTGPVRDERLRLIFTCCHPALAHEARVALTLRLLGGLQTPEIARAFLVPEATMAQRLVRAKRKIRDAHIPYRVPSDADLPERLAAVLAVLYLVYTEGHSASSGAGPVRQDLCRESVRLARMLAGLMPDEPEALGLLALLLLTDARRPARIGPDGALRLLPEQDRALWNRDLIAEGHDLVRRCLRIDRPGPYQLQAAIGAVHCDAARAEDTDWHQILALYDRWMNIAPTPVVALNRAVALAEVAGPAAGLEAVEATALTGYQPYHAARADLLRRLGRTGDAAAAYRRARDEAGTDAERDLLHRRLSEVGGPDEG